MTLRAAATILYVAISVSVGCAWWHSVGKSVPAIVISCTASAVKNNAADLLPTVLTILTGGVINWEAQLEALKAVGEEALACALARAAEELAAPRAGPRMQAVDLETLRRRSEGHDKAKKFLAAHRWDTR